MRNCTSTGQKFERKATYIGQKFEEMGPKNCQMDHDISFDKNIPDANSKKIIQSKKILPVALLTEKDRGQHFVVLVIPM